jgi:hypothetical protein
LLNIFFDEFGQVLDDGPRGAIDDRVLQLDDLLEGVDQLVLQKNDSLTLFVCRLIEISIQIAKKLNSKTDNWNK